MKRVCVVAALLLLGACGTPGSDAATPGFSPASPGPRESSPPKSEQLYEASTTVLESRDQGPMLCLGGVMTSLPPQCGDVPVTNWDWADVAGEESVNGTTWGDWHVVGSFDGERFTLTERPGAPDRSSYDDYEPIGTPCPEPEGGWPSNDAGSSDPDLRAAIRLAERALDVSGVWIDYLEEYEPDSDVDPTGIILTAAFTGNLDEHERELREIWDGPLCMWQHERSLAELEEIRDELHRDDLGLQILTSSIDVVDNVVEIGVVAIGDATQEEIDRRYGAGIVEVDPRLQPVD